MKFYLLYLLTFWLLGYSVSKMLDEAETNALKDIDEHERIAWTSGFERGVKSAS
jgi:hypothetical protein